MHARHWDFVGWGALAVTTGADWLAHNAFTFLSVLGLVISSVCQLTQLWLRLQERESALKKLRLKLFREWERARDHEPPR